MSMGPGHIKSSALVSKKGWPCPWLPSRAPSFSVWFSSFCELSGHIKFNTYFVLSPTRADHVHGYHPVLRHWVPALFTCHRGGKILHSTRCHRSARLTYALLISIFLHDTGTLMLDVTHVGKRMNKAHVKKRVEEHRLPTTEKEQGTSWWSICTHNSLYYSAI